MVNHAIHRASSGQPNDDPNYVLSVHYCEERTPLRRLLHLLWLRRLRCARHGCGEAWRCRPVQEALIEKAAAEQGWWRA